MVAVIAAVPAEHASYSHSIVRFVQELGIGLGAGILGGLVLIWALRATRHIEEGVQAVVVVLGAVLLGALTTTLHGSGFLAVYIAGLLLSDASARQDSTQHAIPDALSTVAEPLLFVTLGAAFAPLVGLGDIGRAIVLTLITVFALRPAIASACLIGSRLDASDRALVSWGGLKGAVPLLLAGYPALDDFDGADTVAATVLVVTAASLVVQGGRCPSSQTGRPTRSNQAGLRRKLRRVPAQMTPFEPRLCRET